MLLKHNRQIFIWALCGVLLFLPISRFMQSVMEIILAINWVLGQNFRSRIGKLKTQKSLLVMLLYFVLFIPSCLMSEDWSEGLFQLKIALPLLAFPVIIGSSAPISKKEMAYLLVSWALGLLICSVWGYWNFFSQAVNNVATSRTMSPVISHILLSIYIHLFIFTLLQYLLRSSTKYSQRISIISFTFILYLLIFQFLMLSFTGLFVMLVGMILWSIYAHSGVRFLLIKKFLTWGIIAIILIFISLFANAWYEFYPRTAINFQKLPDKTMLGNKYVHDTTAALLENGNYVNLYVCTTELRQYWNYRSKIPYDSLDNIGQPLYSTLVRFLTSKNLPKDGFGVFMLKQSEINAIENGVTNVRFDNNVEITSKMYEIIWQLDVYKKNGNPNGHSVTQRFEFWKNGIAVAKKHFWLGAGVGDFSSLIEKQYDLSHSMLSKQNRYKPHSQYITTLGMLGVIGFITLLAIFVFPFVFDNMRSKFLFVFVCTTFLFAFLDEDTLLSQAGVSMFSFFYTLFYTQEHLN